MTISDKIILRLAETAEKVSNLENPKSDPNWAEWESAMQEVYRRADRIKELEAENDKRFGQEVGI